VQDITLTVPAQADYVYILRSVIAGVAAKLNFTVDAIEDLRLAVDEASAYLLGRHAGVTTLSLSIKTGESDLEIVASVDGDPNAPIAGMHDSVVWHLLGALTDEARLDESDGRPSIRFTKSISA
jgi:serine/threonine-protein kinase RsbW